MSASDARALAKKAVINRVYFRMKDATTGAPTAGVAFDSGLASGANKAKWKKDGGAAVNTSASVGASGDGGYYIDLDATECACDHGTLIVIPSTANILEHDEDVYFADRDIDDLAYPATSGRAIGLDAFGSVFAYSAAADALSPTGLTTQSGTAQGGASSSITLATTASVVLDYYVGQQVVLTGGPGAGQARLITGYSTGRVATVDRNWATGSNPTSATTYAVVPNISQAGGLGPASISASTFVAGALDAAALAPDAVAEIVAGIMAKSFAEPVKPTFGANTFEQIIAYMLAWMINEVDASNTAVLLRNAADAANLASHATSDDGTTFVSGPAT